VRMRWEGGPVPPFNRRHFGKLIAGAAAALPLTAAAARTTAATGEAADAAAPLTPTQMEQYRKTLPDQSKELDKLHSFDLGYGYEPDFIFRAVGPRQPAARTSARKPVRKKVKHG